MSECEPPELEMGVKFPLSPFYTEKTGNWEFNSPHAHILITF